MALFNNDNQAAKKLVDAWRTKHPPEVVEFMDELVLHTGKIAQLTIHDFQVDGGFRWDTSPAYPENQATLQAAISILKAEQVLWRNGEVWHLTDFGNSVYEELKKKRALI